MVEANPSSEQVGVREAQERSTSETINGQVRYYEWNEEMTREAQDIIS